MRKSTRDEIHNDRDRRETRADREANQDKWTGLLRSAVNRCGFRLEPENNGMMSIFDPDHKAVIGHAPAHVTSKRKLVSVLERCDIPASFAIH